MLTNSNYMQSKKARKRLGIDQNAAVVLWTGRLELHCKSHHSCTFRAVAHASEVCPQRPWVLLMYGTAVMPSIKPALEQAAKQICPNIHLKLLDGNDLEVGALARAASDMAISLVDCLQETFGLTPVEAMASGLPTVVSDWNGYRDTVVEGRTGYRIKTHSFKPGWCGVDLQQQALHENALDQVSAHISGQISVDALEAGAALARLANSPERAIAMGALGMQRVERHYDWKVVLDQYNGLLEDLAKRRQTAIEKKHYLNIANMKPIPSLFDVFKEWPTQTIGDKTIIETCNDVDLLNRILRLGMVTIYKNELPPTNLILRSFQ